MRSLLVLGLLGLHCLAGAPNLRPRNYESFDYYVLHLDSSVLPTQVAQRLGMTHEGQLGELEGHHIFSSPKHGEDLVQTAITTRRKQRKRGLRDTDALDGVKLAKKQFLKPKLEKRVVPPPSAEAAREMLQPRQGQSDEATLARQSMIMQTLGISDPIFQEQWHLLNHVQVGHDVNVTDVWLQGITGQNATVSIVDDGLDMHSDDLRDNYYAEGSYDFNDQDPEPAPVLSDDKHGTRCAGEVAAVKNNVCGVGVAYDSKVSGIRILSKLITDADEAIAMNYGFQHNQIYSCSWGPPDDGKSMDAPGILIKRAMLNAVQQGRDKKGSIYVFASGNGAASDDNCNFDGYTNSIYSITVGAIDRAGLHPYYSEKCSAQLVVTYSSGSGDAIHTTDVGTNTCTDRHGGTSAAAPLAAGIFALVLSVRPDLTWRDMQYLALMTAVPVNLDDGDWQTTTIGKQFSHTFGYGKIDTWAIVEAAKTWELVKPQAWFYSPWLHVKQEIPQGDQGLSSTFEVTEDMLKEANLARLEHVTVTMNVAHGRRGDLSVDLVSPNGIVSHLSATRRPDDSTAGYVDWTFMSVVHWGESGIGTWTVIVKDTQVNEHNGTFTDWHLKLWGESIDASKATLLPMPNDTDDDNHDDDGIATTTVGADLTSVAPVELPTTPPANPSDHPDRPVNAKPTETPSPVDDTTSPATTTAPAEEEQTSSSTWLPSFLPTFGLGPRTQIWIYGALALILIFCIGLGVYFYLARRRRLRNNLRDDYEFELIRDEEAVGLTGHGTNGRVGGKKGGKRRAGELYDAFAMGSDEEYGDGFSDVDADEEDEEEEGDGEGEGEESGRRGGGDERRGLYRDSVRERDGEGDVHVIGDDDDDEDSDDADRGRDGEKEKLQP